MKDWDATAAAAAFKTTVAGALGTFYGWAVSSEGATLIGLALAIGGFFTNWYFQRRRDKRETVIFEQQMRK